MTKEPIQKIIRLDQIDWSDRSYIYAFEPPISEMIQSIRQIGLLNPPILEETMPETYRIVSGLRRIIALDHLGHHEFPAKIYSEAGPGPDLNLFLLNLYDNAAIRKFSIVEKAHILDRLTRLFQMTGQEIYERIFPLLELGRNPQVLTRYLKLVSADDSLKVALVADEISPDTVLQLLDLSLDDRKNVFQLFQQLKIGKNNQKEVLRLLIDISNRDEMPVSRIIDQPAFARIMTDEKLTLPVKANLVKESLKKLRYPRLSQAEMQFDLLKKKMKLPPTIRLSPPPYFEGDKFSVEFSFRNKSEFERALKILNSMAEEKELETMHLLV
ncbi:MAG: ParB/RepB/Spo0J family partition protein [Candidatus Zhuqueibacterota bacterium]